MSISDLTSYTSQKQTAFCYKLENNYKLCGPNLPSSGTICIAQALIIYEELLKISKSVDLTEVLKILDYIYYARSINLADPDFNIIDYELLLNKKTF